MEDLADVICRALGIPSIDTDDQAIMLDDDVLIYIKKEGDSINLLCPFCALPENINDLIYALSLNYSEKICLATDDEGGSLIARLDLTGINEFEDIYVNTEYYISRVRWLKDEFARRMKGY